LDSCGGVRKSWARRVFFFEMDFLRLGKGMAFSLNKAVSGQLSAFS